MILIAGLFTTLARHGPRTADRPTPRFIGGVSPLFVSLSDASVIHLLPENSQRRELELDAGKQSPSTAVWDYLGALRRCRAEKRSMHGARELATYHLAIDVNMRTIN